MAPVEARELVAATDDERAALAEIGSLLDEPLLRAPMLVDDRGRRVTLPASVVRVLRRAVPALAEGHGIVVAPVPDELTTQQAAEFLDVPRPYLLQLLADGHLPSTTDDVPRRIRLDDLLALDRTRKLERRRALTELTQLSQDIGLYANGSDSVGDGSRTG